MGMCDAEEIFQTCALLEAFAKKSFVKQSENFICLVKSICLCHIQLGFPQKFIFVTTHVIPVSMDYMSNSYNNQIWQ